MRRTRAPSPCPDTGGARAHGPRFALVPLLADPLDVALPAGHPPALSGDLRPADLPGEPWIFGASGPWSEITLAACEAADFVPEQAHSAAGRRSRRRSRQEWAWRRCPGWRLSGGTAC